MKQRKHFIYLLVGTMVAAPWSSTWAGGKLGTKRGALRTDQVVSFGDSLTDNEGLYLLFGTAEENYGKDPIEAFFCRAAENRPDDQLLNFAVLGSTSSDVRLQVNAYVAARQNGLLPPATLHSLQAGGNDILDIVNGYQNLFLLASAAPGENEAADAVIATVKKNLLDNMADLRKVDDAELILWTVPDVSFTPFVLSFGFSPQQQSNWRAHIAKLNRFIRAISARGDTTLLDIDLIGLEATFNPPVILGTVIKPTPNFGDRTDQFADPIHPTGVMNAIAANALIDAVNDRYDMSINPYNEVELAEIAGIEP